MISNLLLLILGLALIVFGADWLVDGASSVARRVGVSEFVIGLTIVGFGTSCPELVVSLSGALRGNADISIGNVVGSNIFNTLLILGVTALLSPVAMTHSNRRRDIPVTLLVTFLFVFLGMNSSLLGLGDTDSISRIEGVVFLCVFALYLYSSFRNDEGFAGVEEEGKVLSPLVSALAIVGGLGALIGGGQLFVDNAVRIGQWLGVSDKFIAVTVLAGGTSLPELATCIVASIKGKDQLALGNILGSNVFNILLILGLSSIVTPLSMSGMNLVDISVLLTSVIFLWICAYTGKKNVIDRWEGALLVLIWLSYFIYLIYSINN